MRLFVTLLFCVFIHYSAQAQEEHVAYVVDPVLLQVGELVNQAKYGEAIHLLNTKNQTISDADFHLNISFLIRLSLKCLERSDFIKAKVYISRAFYQMRFVMFQRSSKSLTANECMTYAFINALLAEVDEKHRVGYLEKAFYYALQSEKRAPAQWMPYLEKAIMASQFIDAAKAELLEKIRPH